MPQLIPNDEIMIYENFIARCSSIERAIHRLSFLGVDDIDAILDDVERIHQANITSYEQAAQDGRFDYIGFCQKIAECIDCIAYSFQTGHADEELVLSCLKVIKDSAKSLRLKLIKEMNSRKEQARLNKR